MALRPFPFVWKSIKFSCLWGRSSELLGRDIRKEHSALLSGLQHLRKTVRKQEHSDHLKNTYLKGSLESHRSAVEKKTERENNRGEAGSKKRKQDQLFCSNTLTYLFTGALDPSGNEAASDKSLLQHSALIWSPAQLGKNCTWCVIKHCVDMKWSLIALSTRYGSRYLSLLVLVLLPQVKFAVTSTVFHEIKS